MVFTPLNKLDQLLDAVGSIGMPRDSVPLLNLRNSRTLAMVYELKSVNPIFFFEDGHMIMTPNLDFGTENFKAMLSYPLSLRDYYRIRQVELRGTPEQITIDLSKPEIE